MRLLPDGPDPLRQADHYSVATTSAHNRPLAHQADVHKKLNAQSKPIPSLLASLHMRLPFSFSPSPNGERAAATSETMAEEMCRHPYLHCMLAGGLGGTTGDMLMHSLDTVKTRQQGDPHFPPKYNSMSGSYATILREEGVRRGLYGGVAPAFLGSFPGTVIFFGTYEWTKRKLLDHGMNPTLSFLSAGFVADFAASGLYVPSEVLKTRLQLQGRHNNPHFKSGYNYHSTWDAFRTIIRVEGFAALFSGYKATIGRDLPFSALQFAFYEQAQQWAQRWGGARTQIGLPLEILTAGSAGGLAGLLTCPLDVVKTRIQTQRHSTQGPKNSHAMQKTGTREAFGRTSRHRQAAPMVTRHPPKPRSISTSSPSGLNMPKGAPPLNTSSILVGLKLIYQSEGVAGWFRGAGPRLVWTSVQSSVMLVMYQVVLRQLKQHFGDPDDESY